MTECERKTYGCILRELEKADNDTRSSKTMFLEYEEGQEDKKIIREGLKNKRRDWLVLADIYNNGEQNQKFHLKTYIEFKLNNGYSEGDKLYDGWIRNAALYFYIREEFYGDDVTFAFERAKKFYEGPNPGKVNQVIGLHNLSADDA
ncbi:hypothetical protein [Levilactobacillus humaensis]|uniref:hypothetical protein n=1 Tax=Levilactobacillus humaensis TaxID=2950375 RepID=UPI0021C48E49|nr:hypothetical protein [Levilactobacillus humaensis]